MSVKRMISLGELVNLEIDSLLVKRVEISLGHSSADSATSVITACDKHHNKSNGRTMVNAQFLRAAKNAFIVPLTPR